MNIRNIAEKKSHTYKQNVIAVSIGKELIDRLDALALEQKVSRSRLYKDILSKHLEDFEASRRTNP